MSKHVSLKSLSSYLDGRVKAEKRGLLEVHITTCKTCKDKFLSLKAVKEIVGRLPEVAESEGFDFGFKRRIEEALARRTAVYQERPQEILESMRFKILRPVPVLVKTAALVTITAFFMVSIFWYQMGVMPVIASVKGKAEVYNFKDKEWQRAVGGMKLRDGDIIRVGSASRVNIESKKYEILFKENTEVRAVNLEKAFSRKKDISYRLNRGKMLIATKKVFKGSRLTIDSPSAEVEAKGTGFLVNVSPAQMNRTWVGVLNGEVEVESKIKQRGLPYKVLVDAGKATEVFPNSVPTPPRYQLEDEWKEVQEIYRLGEQPQVVLLISMTPRRVYELLGPAPLYFSGKKTEVMPRELVKIVGKINEAIIKKDKEKHLDAVYSLEKLLKKYPDPRYNIQFLFFIASYYYYVDEYKKSISVLDRIIEEYPNSNLISLALCAKGLIYERGLKDPQKAASLYKAVLVNYPKSLEAKEAAPRLNRLKGE